jgi:hypothetical protein
VLLIAAVRCCDEVLARTLEIGLCAAEREAGEHRDETHATSATVRAELYPPPATLARWRYGAPW